MRIDVQNHIQNFLYNKYAYILHTCTYHSDQHVLTRPETGKAACTAEIPHQMHARLTTRKQLVWLTRHTSSQSWSQAIVAVQIHVIAHVITRRRSALQLQLLADYSSARRHKCSKLLWRNIYGYIARIHLIELGLFTTTHRISVLDIVAMLLLIFMYAYAYFFFAIYPNEPFDFVACLLVHFLTLDVIDRVSETRLYCYRTILQWSYLLYLQV